MTQNQLLNIDDSQTQSEALDTLYAEYDLDDDTALRDVEEQELSSDIDWFQHLANLPVNPRIVRR